MRAARAVVAALALLGALALAAPACGSSEPELERLFPAPSFTLTDQHGERFSSARLRGKVWIASFFYTSCRSICPMTTSKMANVRRRLASAGDDFWLVSLSVDPEHDTPEAMSIFARRMRAQARNWRFLTGTRAEMEAAITRGFKQVMQDDPHDGSSEDVLHGTRLVLVDRGAVVRGLYETDGPGLDRLVHDAGRLLAEDAP